MHHSLKFYDSYPLRLYSRYEELVLRFYMFGARMTRLPLLGRLVRMVANLYGRKVEAGYLLTLNEAEQVVDIAEGLAVGACTCRTVFHNCDNPVQVEIMLGLTRNVFIDERPQDYREISREEAKGILRECHGRGLIHAIIKCRQDFYAICNCCSCCCVPLRMSKRYGIGNAISRNGNIIQEFRQHQLAHAD